MARKTNRKFQLIQDGNTTDISYKYVKPSRTKSINLVPRSVSQESLVLSLCNPNTDITIAVGPAGSGKSYLGMLAALKSFQQNECSKIIITRPAVGVEEEKHGFLPGDLNAKMEPWTRPLTDIMKEFYTPAQVNKFIEDEIIEISPLAFMRGRTFKNSWIVADEMQNATPNQVKMLLTRIGEGSKIIITGDIEQTDKTISNNGLLDLCSRLDAEPTPGLDVCRLGLKDIQRHPIISSVLNLYRI